MLHRLRLVLLHSSVRRDGWRQAWRLVLGVEWCACERLADSNRSIRRNTRGPTRRLVDGFSFLLVSNDGCSNCMAVASPSVSSDLPSSRRSSFPLLVFPFVSHTRLGFPGFSDGFSRTDQSTPQQDGSSHKHSQTSCWTVHRIAMSTSTRAPRASAPPKRFSPSDGAGGAAGTVQVRGRRCGSHGKRWRTRADGTRTDR